MGKTILVLGPSGSGKSTSMRNLPQDEVAVLNVLGKPLPFRTPLPKMDFPSYEDITRKLEANRRRCFVIDDSTYLMQLENFAYANVKGYDKFTTMAVNFQKLVMAALRTDDDTTVYFLHHSDTGDDGREKPKTIGRMLDERFCLEGAFPIVIDCRVKDGRHEFVTVNDDGQSICKAPMGMLPEVMDNDLAEVDRLVREYWGMAPLGAEKEKGPKEEEN